MGKKGGLRHLKRLASPGFWPVHRKEYAWVKRAAPGPHPLVKSIPLLILIREKLRLARTAKEARAIISEGKVKIDNIMRFDEKFPVGLMDAVDIPSMNKSYRLVPSQHHMFKLVSISDREKTLKPCRIENMSTTRRGFLQLNLHDGRNIRVRITDESATAKYHTKDTLMIDLTRNEIVEQVPLAEGSSAVITGGKNNGISGVITKIHGATRTAEKIVSIRTADDQEFSSTINYVFPLGKTSTTVAFSEVV